MPTAETLDRVGLLGRKQQAVGRWGRKNSERAARSELGCGPVTFFLLFNSFFFYQKQVLVVFCLILGKFHLVFLCKNYPTKLLCRKQKSKSIASEKYKEFYS